MISVLQWSALAACVVCTMWRFPAMLKGRNRSLFWVFLLMSTAVALSLPAIYLPIDGLLGGANIANVILRLSLFGAFFLLAGKVAAAYNSQSAYYLVRGPIGVAVLLACSAGIWITFFIADTQGSSTGLSGIPAQKSLTVYGWLGFLYMGYAAGCLVVPTAKAVFSPRKFLDRAAAALMCLGFILVCLDVPLQISVIYVDALVKVVSFTSILCITSGLALVWMSYIRRRTQRTMVT